MSGALNTQAGGFEILMIDRSIPDQYRSIVCTTIYRIENVSLKQHWLRDNCFAV